MQHLEILLHSENVSEHYLYEQAVASQSGRRGTRGTRRSAAGSRSEMEGAELSFFRQAFCTRQSTHERIRNTQTAVRLNQVALVAVAVAVAVAGVDVGVGVVVLMTAASVCSGGTPRFNQPCSCIKSTMRPVLFTSATYVSIEAQRRHRSKSYRSSGEHEPEPCGACHRS